MVFDDSHKTNDFMEDEKSGIQEQSSSTSDETSGREQLTEQDGKKVQEDEDEDDFFLDPDEIIAKIHRFDTIELDISLYQNESQSSETSNNTPLQKDKENPPKTLEFTSSLNPPQETSDKEHVEARTPRNISKMKYLSPDEICMEYEEESDIINEKPEEKEHATNLPPAEILQVPDGSEQTEASEASEQIEKNDKEELKKKRKPLERVPAEVPILDKLAALVPSSLADEEQDQEVFNPLDLGPLLRKKDIDSPFDLISPDDIGTEEEFLSRALPKDTLVQNRYKILRVVSEKRDRTSYIVKDLIKEKKFVLKEMYSENFSKEELKNRRDKFLDSVRIINTFKHKNLAEVYLGFTDNGREYCVMEQINGIDLKKLSDMNTKPFTEKEVVKWGLELCDAVDFLHHRPTPFTLERIEPDSIMVNEEGALKITNFDLQRFFDSDRTLEFMPDDPKHLYNDITNLARVFFFLLTKQQYHDGTININWPDTISLRMQKLLEIACYEGQKTYGDIREFREKFIMTQSPEPDEEFVFEKKKKDFPIHQFDFSWLSHWGKAIVSQKPFMLALEIIVFLFLLIIPIGYRIMNKTYARPAGSLAYVSSIDELHVISFNEFKNIHNIKMEGEISYIYPAEILLSNNRGNKPEVRKALLICYLNSERIEVLDSRNLKRLQSFTAIPGIVKIIRGEEDGKIYALSSTHAQMCVIDLGSLKVDRVLPVGIEPVDLVYIPQVSNQLGSWGRNVIPFYAAAEFFANRVVFIDPRKGLVSHFLDLPGKPASLAVSGDGKYTFAADSTGNKIIKIQNETFKISDSLQLSDESPSDLVYDERNGRLWVSFKNSNSVKGININDRSVLPSGFAGISPIKMVLDEPSRTIWVLNEKSKDVVVIDAETGSFKKKIEIDKTPSSISIEPGF
jgi:hypothetical protein